MDVEDLRTLVAIHRSGSVTKAATSLFRSQPAVSRRLALLERELGVPLFERVPGGVTASDAGRALLPFAESVIATLRDAEAAVRDLRSDDRGPVALALVGTLASTSLTTALRRFALRRPDVELSLRTATSREISELVRRADVTMGLRYHHDHAPDLHCEQLFAERLVVVAAPDHRCAGRSCASLEVLAQDRWLAFPVQQGRPEPVADGVRRALEGAGVTEERIRWIDSLTAQKRLVEAGFGIAMMPDSAVREEVASGSLVVLDVDELDLTQPVVLVTRRGGYLPGAAEALREELRARTRS